ncbi:MAG: hypothetical protein KJ060_04215 [Candidatus Hydrogenedentes bacterium]|nr:hypothetical protein [Candidatus Hydrogenedentota bacterium]
MLNRKTTTIRADREFDVPYEDIFVEVDLRPALHFIAIIALAVVAAVAYGILHDLVTAHVCVEYFTVAHPRIVDSESPVVLALVWGVMATWWMGLLLGVPLAFACGAGKRPKRSALDVAPAVGKLLVAMACCATVAGLAAYGLSRLGVLTIPMFYLKLIPAETLPRFAATLWAHNASYAFGVLGGLIVIVGSGGREGNHLEECLHD